MSAASARQDFARSLLAQSRESEATPRPGVTAWRTQPVRLSVSLPPALHNRFREWTVKQSAEVGVPDVPMSSVIRAVVRLMVDDPVLGRRVVAAVLEEQ